MYRHRSGRGQSQGRSAGQSQGRGPGSGRGPRQAGRIEVEGDRGRTSSGRKARHHPHLSSGLGPELGGAGLRALRKFLCREL
ncbi:MAG: hypothetical protein EBT03_02110 [Betaproteobacteria bacterium]|nr:hypothetical protein [Betaproteobacteria bacterium]NCA15636.1 hypothetical protein [Betaproteobacteria bacterium]